MADNLAQADPQAAPSPAPPAAPSPLAALPDAGSSTATTQPTPAPNEQPQADVLASVDSGDAYAAILAEALAQPDPQPGVTPAAEPGTPEATTGTDPNAPANETTTEPPPAANADDDDARIPDRIRLGGLSEKDRALTSAAVLLAKAEGIPVTEAMARIAGKPSEPAATPPAPAQVSDPGAIRAKIAELERAEEEAGEQADTVKLAKLAKEIRAAERELAEAETSQARATHNAEQQFKNQVTASRAQARELYPMLKDPQSPLAKKWVEVANRLEAANDPLVTGNNPNFALVVSQMAAAELGIAPAPKGAPAAKASPPTPTPATTQPAAARPVQPAPGSARTTAPSNPTGQLESRLAGVKNTDDYEALMREAIAAA